MAMQKRSDSHCGVCAQSRSWFCLVVRGFCAVVRGIKEKTGTRQERPPVMSGGVAGCKRPRSPVEINRNSTVPAVEAWVEKLGLYADVAQSFKQRKINGKDLFEKNSVDVFKRLNCLKLGDRIVVCEALNKLREIDRLSKVPLTCDEAAARQEAAEYAAQQAAIAAVNAGNRRDPDRERATTPVQWSPTDPERDAATVKAVSPTDGMNPHGGGRVCIRGRWYPPLSPPQ